MASWSSQKSQTDTAASVIGFFVRGEKINSRTCRRQRRHVFTRLGRLWSTPDGTSSKANSFDCLDIIRLGRLGRVSPPLFSTFATEAACVRRIRHYPIELLLI